MKWQTMIIVLLILQICQNGLGAEFDAGPITSSMNNLAVNTAKITDDISVQFNGQIKRIIASISGRMEIILSNGMDQLTEPLFVAMRKVNNESCVVIWTIDELVERLNKGLNACTSDLNKLKETFQLDAELLAKNMRWHAYEITQLPESCELFNGNDDAMNNFASSTSCFVEKIAQINQAVGMELTNSNALVRETQQSTQELVNVAEQCTNNVVNEMINYLDTTLKHC